MDETIMSAGEARFDDILKEQVRIQEQQDNLAQQKAKIQETINSLISSSKLLDYPSAQNSIEKQIKALEAQMKKLDSKSKMLQYEQKESEAQARIIQSILGRGSPEFEDLRRRCKTRGKIYFRDLAILRAFDPKKFKDLVVTAVRKDNGELTIFNAQNTPNVEIALACRASASIPVVFAPVSISIPIKVKNKHGLEGNSSKTYEFVDGGYRDNIPTKYFDQAPKKPVIDDITDDPKKTKAAVKAGRTMAFAFSGNDMDTPVNVAIYSAKKKIYKPNIVTRFLKDVLFKSLARVGGKFKYTETEKQTYDELRSNALNIVPLDTKNIGTLSFDEATRRADYLHIKGYIDTMQHMHNHNLTESVDKAFAQKSFLLQVYEKVSTPSRVQSWIDLIDKTREVKVKELLSFCKSEKWEGKDANTILEEYIILAATKRPSGLLSHDTRSIKALVETLNSPSSTDAMKERFILTLKGKDFLLKNPYLDLGKFKFKPDDCKELLSRSKPIKLQHSSSPNL